MCLFMLNISLIMISLVQSPVHGCYIGDTVRLEGYAMVILHSVALIISALSPRMHGGG